MRSNEKNDAAYINMYNIYSDIGMVKDAKKVENMFRGQWTKVL